MSYYFIFKEDSFSSTYKQGLTLVLREDEYSEFIELFSNFYKFKPTRKYSSLMKRDDITEEELLTFEGKKYDAIEPLNDRDIEGDRQSTILQLSFLEQEANLKGVYVPSLNAWMSTSTEAMSNYHTALLMMNAIGRYELFDLEGNEVVLVRSSIEELLLEVVKMQALNYENRKRLKSILEDAEEPFDVDLTDGWSNNYEKYLASKNAK